MVPRAGLEPAQRERRGILNPLCLPIPPPGHAILIAMRLTVKLRHHLDIAIAIPLQFLSHSRCLVTSSVGTRCTLLD